MPPKKKSSDARCVLCGGNLPANYKGCTVYKDPQEKTCPPLCLKQYTLPAQIKQTLRTQPGVTYAPITKQNSYAATNIEQDPHIKTPHQQTSDTAMHICMCALKKNKLHGLSPRANYTDRATAACRRSECINVCIYICMNIH
jgi:hypothetical protein